LDLTHGDDIWRLIVDAENTDHLYRQRWVEIGTAGMVWKMPQFDLTGPAVEDLFSKARNKEALILDLRGNPGGYETSLQAMVGALMDHEVTIATPHGTKPNLKPVVAKSRGKSAFAGKIAVLIDAGSGSAAELLARVVQLEKRGIVLGDRSSGHVMQSRYYPMTQGAATESLFGASITEADLLMADGKSLEHAGVVPDEIVLPAAADVAAGRDPVLARAAELLGIKLDAVAAGKLFPAEW
jgi:C-terminal processing protease CtpA/Prc